MDAWIYWLIAGVILAVGEMHFSGFFLGPFAGGALAATIVAAVGGGFVVALVLFFVVTTALFLGLRPIARRHLRQTPELRTGTAALVGRPGMVLERIANDEGVGVVKIDGEVWTARSYDEDHTIDAGRRVQVIEIRGATALVSEE